MFFLYIYTISVVNNIYIYKFRLSEQWSSTPSIFEHQMAPGINDFNDLNL